jgi:hypothetical protein
VVRMLGAFEYYGGTRNVYAHGLELDKICIPAVDIEYLQW